MKRCLWALQCPSGSLMNNYDGTSLLYRRRRDALYVARQRKQAQGRDYTPVPVHLQPCDEPESPEAA